jgi:hypothetical protein
MDCCDNSGSTIHIRAGGRSVSVRGTVTVRPYGKETTADANSDGSMFVTTKAKLWEMDITLSDKCGFSLDDLMDCHVDITAILPELHRKYFLTKARVVGMPSTNVETGEITGLMVACPKNRAEQVNNI